MVRYTITSRSQVYDYNSINIEIEIFFFSEFLATQNKQYFWSLINDVSSFDLFTPDARMKIKTFFFFCLI
jgi:hypothetical protein